MTNEKAVEFVQACRNAFEIAMGFEAAGKDVRKFITIAVANGADKAFLDRTFDMVRSVNVGNPSNNGGAW